MTPREIIGHQFAYGEYSPPLGHDCTFHGVAKENGSTRIVVWTKGVVGKGKMDTPDMVKAIAIYDPNAPIWKAACA
jgi:hypothetical protein